MVDVGRCTLVVKFFLSCVFVCKDICCIPRFWVCHCQSTRALPLVFAFPKVCSLLIGCYLSSFSLPALILFLPTNSEPFGYIIASVPSLRIFSSGSGQHDLTIC